MINLRGFANFIYQINNFTLIKCINISMVRDPFLYAKYSQEYWKRGTSRNHQLFRKSVSLVNVWYNAPTQMCHALGEEAFCPSRSCSILVAQFRGVRQLSFCGHTCASLTTPNNLQQDTKNRCHGPCFHISVETILI